MSRAARSRTTRGPRGPGRISRTVPTRARSSRVSGRVGASRRPRRAVGESRVAGSRAGRRCRSRSSPRCGRPWWRRRARSPSSVAREPVERRSRSSGPPSRRSGRCRSGHATAMRAGAAASSGWTRRPSASRSTVARAFGVGGAGSTAARPRRLDGQLQRRRPRNRRAPTASSRPSSRGRSGMPLRAVSGRHPAGQIDGRPRAGFECRELERAARDPNAVDRQLVGRREPRVSRKC